MWRWTAGGVRQADIRAAVVAGAARTVDVLGAVGGGSGHISRWRYDDFQLHVHWRIQDGRETRDGRTGKVGWGRCSLDLWRIMENRFGIETRGYGVMSVGLKQNSGSCFGG